MIKGQKETLIIQRSVFFNISIFILIIEQI